ncbi:hypothetical protein ACOMHN_047774 [Nucella lapillus]
MSESTQTPPTKVCASLARAPVVVASSTFSRVSEADLMDEPRSVMDRPGPGSDPVPPGSPSYLPSISRGGAAIFSAALDETDVALDERTQAFMPFSVNESLRSSRAATKLPPSLTTATSVAFCEKRVSPSPFGAVEKPMPMGGLPLPHWVPPFDGSALEAAVGSSSNRTRAPPADASPTTRRETPPMGYLGSPMRPAGVQISTRRRDLQDPPSPDPVLSLSVRDLFAFLQTQSGGGKASEQDIPVDSSRGGSHSANPTRTRSRPQHAHPREETLGADTSGHQATRGTAKLPWGHRTFATSCVGPQSTQVAPAARSARDLGPSASTNYPLATPVATDGSQGPLRPMVPIDNWPKGDDQVFLPSSNSWGRWSSVDCELDTSVWHSSARRWVLVPPTFPAFADSPPPTFSHPPRGATDSESDEGLEEDHSRSFMEHGPSRARPRAQSLHGQDSGSCRAPSPPDFLEDEAPPGSSVTAGALLQPVLPHFLTTAQPTEKADNEVLCLFGQPSIAPTSVVRLRTPTNVMQSGERLANKARGSKSLHDSSQEGHQFPSALPVGKVFSLKPLRSRSSNDFEESSPLFWTADPTSEDRRLLRPGLTPAKLDTSFKDYSDLDRYFRSALISCSRNQRFLGALAVAHQRAAEGIAGAFDDVLTFGRRALAEVDAAIDTLTEARFNTILTRRDTFLRASPLSAEDRNALRCIPPQPNSLFGQFGSAALRRHSEQARESAWASSQPHRQAPKRANYYAPKGASYSQAPAPPAKKPRSGFRQGHRPRQPGPTQTQARRRPPPGVPGRKPPSTF